MFNKSETEKEQALNMSHTKPTQQWKWFFGLYILGFITLTGVAYLLKGAISFL